MKKPVLYIVMPCYNEEEALPMTAEKLIGLLDDMENGGRIDPMSRVLMVDDGSRDRTWEVICRLNEYDKRFEGVKLAHNVGHMNALWAGMSTAVEKCDALITIDADLQDDINAMYGFLDEYENGCDVVYGVRSDRSSDSPFKRITAQGFYKVMRIMGAETVYNHADYRLLSRRATEALLSFGETNMFLRGMVPLLGFKSAQVEYRRGARVAGESKYPIKKMMAFAIEGITSFSVKPIRWVTWLGFISTCMSIIALIYVLASFFTGRSVAGWSSIIISVWLLGGLQLIAIGLIGEYIGKIYMEVKHRPKFIIEEKVGC